LHLAAALDLKPDLSRDMVNANTFYLSLTQRNEIAGSRAVALDSD